MKVDFIPLGRGSDLPKKPKEMEVQRLPGGPKGPKSSIPEVSGVINTIKQGFGFIQPFQTEEQIYFGGRELTPDLRIGDFVAFQQRDSVRGMAAENVRLLKFPSANDNTLFKGCITRSPDRHRSNFGMITVEGNNGPKDVYFNGSDVVAKSLPRNHRIDKGDYVEFALSKVVNIDGLCFARNVSLLQLKRDYAVTQQIQRMLESGVVREKGIVTTLKNGEYGFIRPLDRKEEVYFRMDMSAGAGAGAAVNSNASSEQDLKITEVTFSNGYHF
jgi:cold shock CspA family protein